MRYIQVRLIPELGGFDYGDIVFANDDTVAHSAIHYVNELDDGSYVMLHELIGNLTRIEQIYEQEPGVISYDIISTNESNFVYVHEDYSSNELASQMLDITSDFGLILDLPIESVGDGSLRIGAIIEDEDLGEVLSALPESISVDVEYLGEYRPEVERIHSKLTDRQKEILSLAVSRGYFSEPRQVTAKDLADELSISPSAVSKSLRRIEAIVFSEIVP